MANYNKILSLDSKIITQVTTLKKDEQIKKFSLWIRDNRKTLELELQNKNRTILEDVIWLYQRFCLDDYRLEWYYENKYETICMIDFCGNYKQDGFWADYIKSEALVVFGGSWRNVPTFYCDGIPSESELYDWAESFELIFEK